MVNPSAHRAKDAAADVVADAVADAEADIVVNVAANVESASSIFCFLFSVRVWYSIACRFIFSTTAIRTL